MSGYRIAMQSMGFKPNHQREGCWNCKNCERRLGNFGEGDLWCSRGGFWVGRSAICNEHAARLVPTLTTQVQQPNTGTNQAS